jgi:FAD-dependent urate hydroxylase
VVEGIEFPIYRFEEFTAPNGGHLTGPDPIPGETAMPVDLGRPQLDAWVDPGLRQVDLPDVTLLGVHPFRLPEAQSLGDYRTEPDGAAECGELKRVRTLRGQGPRPPDQHDQYRNEYPSVKRALSPRILIVGGGIAGLALARALRQRQLSAEIVERAVEEDHIGTGLFLPANGVRALRMLGLHEFVQSRGCAIPRQRVLDHRGRLLLDVGLDEIWGPAGPCVAVHRRDLHELLREAAGVPIRHGTSIEFVDIGAVSARVRLSDGFVGEYDVVVGADGIHSSVRRLVFGGVEPRYVGQVSWRMVVEGGPPITAWTVMLARRRAFLVVPIGEGRLYCYADVNSPDKRDPTDGVFHRLVDLFGEFHEPVPGILHRLSPAEPVYFSPIEEVKLHSWVKGRVVLIGDAAHATSPNMAQGAAMAMEDALVLAEVLASGQPVAACLTAFEARRVPRVQWVQAQTHRRDRTRNLPPAIRDCVLRIAGKRIFKGNNRPLVKEP